jgi:16S rRNA processing protein RimM
MTSREKTGRRDEGAGLVLLGRINSAQGLRGEVRVTSYTARPEDIAAYGPFTDQKGRSFTVEGLRVIKGSVLAIRLAGIADRTAAEALKGAELYVKKARLPETAENEWYYDDLVGLRAVALDGEEIGEVVAVQNYGAGDLLEIRLKDSRQTAFVPFTEEAAPDVDVKSGHITVIMPEEIEGPLDV